MGRKREYGWREWCSFGDHEIEDGPRMHVYPIPVCEAFPKGGDRPHHGATSCATHFPAALALQVEQGLVGRA